MRVLITGGAGFIGSHLAIAYERRGFEVVVLDNLSTGNLANLTKYGFQGEVVNGDIRDELKIQALTQRSDLVLHMAAALGVANIMNYPLESISTNIAGSQVVLKAATKHEKRILIASTSEIYGKNPIQPLSEEDDRVIGTPQNIRWSYSDAKAIEEAMARSLNIQKGLEVTTARFFNTVGPGQTGRYGMVIPKFVRSALRNEEILVHGDGSQRRVFCHVDDVINAVYKLMETEASIGEVYNIGGKDEISIDNLAKVIALKSGSNSEIRHIPYSEVYPIGFEDMARRIPNIAKIQRTIDWKPEKNLENIIDDVIQDFQRNPGFD